MPEHRKLRKQPSHFKPCDKGDLIKIYLNQEYGSSECTYGLVIRLNERLNPIIAYKNLSKLKLGDFDRLILWKDVEFSGDYIVHGEAKKNEPPVYNPETI